MGMIYKRGKTYWIKYYRNGKPYYESTKSKKETDAKRLLKKREEEISQGKLPVTYFDRVWLQSEKVAKLARVRGMRKSLICLVREGGLEPPIPKWELDPKSSAFANFATLAQRILIFCKKDNILCSSCRELQESATKKSWGTECSL